MTQLYVLMLHQGWQTQTSTEATGQERQGVKPVEGEKHVVLDFKNFPFLNGDMSMARFCSTVGKAANAVSKMVKW